MNGWNLSHTFYIGYGQEFTDSIQHHWGSHPYRDLEKGLDYILETYEFLDADRVAGLGASYGGYMINWLNGHSDRFKAFVNHDGMFSTVQAYYTTEELYFVEHDVGYRMIDNNELFILYFYSLAVFLIILCHVSFMNAGRHPTLSNTGRPQLLSFMV